MTLVGKEHPGAGIGIVEPLPGHDDDGPCSDRFSVCGHPLALPGLEAAGDVLICRISRCCIDAVQENLDRCVSLFQPAGEIRRNDQYGVGLTGVHQGDGFLR